MHEEIYQISSNTFEEIKKTKEQGGRIVAIGTTVLRALESAFQNNKVSEEFQTTKIFIKPGYQFKIVDALFTNFHLPKSTLLMLVSAFAGHEFIKKAYEEAILNKYRFFSYGDAMFIEQKDN
jgi:S-adenosylmethionine:tRNA ribosyltransferase-isomerase